MADRPILFSAPMVLSLLADSKTQTRRLVNPQPFADGYYEGEVDCTFVPAPASNLQAYARFGAAAVGGGAIRTETFTPRIQPGDALWVREAWRTFVSLDGTPPRDIWSPGCGRGAGVFYEADEGGSYRTREGEFWPAVREGRAAFGKLRPSMFMPRWASRITLSVTDVRVQRLHDISEEDALAEGVVPHERGGFHVIGVDHPNRDFPYLARPTAREMYAALWDVINGSGAWGANPWVVAYGFSVERRNIDAKG